jgi:hypothetical protein
MGETSGVGRAQQGVRRDPAQLIALAFGIVFLLVGILGFIPGITTNYGTMRFAGHESQAELLGLFQVSVLHNIVHLLYGVVGVALSRRPSSARGYLVVGGLIYLILWIYGLVVDGASAANFVPLNTADNWLHLGLAVVMVLLGLLRYSPRTGRSPGTRG